jgi:hypothetical protein
MVKDRLSPWTRRALEIGFNSGNWTFQEDILPNAKKWKNPVAGLHGMKYPSMFSFPAHFWVSPILHSVLGLVKDWLTLVKTFCKTWVETLLEEEVNFREHLVILGDMLDNLLMEQDRLNPKETIKEYQTHLKVAQKDIKKQDVGILNKGTGQMITQPGRVSPEEQQLIQKLQWEIESCTEQSSKCTPSWNKNSKRTEWEKGKGNWRN